MTSIAAALAGSDAADLADALDRVTFPAYVTDAQGRVRGLNSAAVAFVGDVRGQFVDTQAVPADRPKVRTSVARKLVGADATEMRVRVLAADGKVRPIEVSSVPIRHHGRVIGLFGIFHEVEIPAVRVDPERRLTPREHEVLTHLVAGCSTDQMAELMGLSRATVRNHVTRLLRALGVHSRLEAVAVARREGLVG